MPVAPPENQSQALTVPEEPQGNEGVPQAHRAPPVQDPLSSAIQSVVRIVAEGQDPRLTGVNYTAAYLLSDAGQARLVEAVATKEQLYCGCCAPFEFPPLYVWQRDGRYWLSKYKDTGPLHDLICDRYESPEALLRRQKMRQSAAAIEAVGDRFAVNLSVPLFERAHEVSFASPSTEGKTTPAESRTTTLLGLLCFAFEKAGLCEFEPGTERSFTKITARLEQVFHCMDVGDSPLSGRLFLPRLHNQERMTRLVDAVRTPHAQGRQFLLLMGVVTRAWVGDDFVELKLEAWRPSVWVTRKLWDSALKHSFSAHARRSMSSGDPISEKSRLVIVARMAVHAEGRMELDHLSIVATTRDFIPVPSSYELTFVNYVAALDRHFRKPLLQPLDGPFSDLILLDTVEPHFCEVLGRRNASYHERNAPKLEMLAKDYPDRHTVWDAANGEPLPPLPPKAKKSE